MGRDVIIALDFPSGAAALSFLDGFGETRPFVKVGMELYYAEGPELVRELKARGHALFLDLKLHDIPNTVGRAMRVIGGLGADMINVHAAGGSQMMKSARESCPDALLIAVTQLTSTSPEALRDELLISATMEETVVSYARMAREAGLDGVVCSPLEAGLVKSAVGAGFIAVTPGVRFADGAVGDQKRVTTPARANELGSDYIVVGRPITAASDPLAAYQRCLNDFVGGIQR